MQQPNRNRSPFRNTLLYLVIGLAILGIVNVFTDSSSFSGRTQEITSTQFISQLENNEIEEFEIQIGSGVYHVRGEYSDTQSVEETDENLVQEIGRASCRERV